MDVTLFEIHLDGAQFGPATIGGESEGNEATAGPVEGGSGGRSAPRALRFVPVFVAVAVGYAAWRRFRGGSDGDGDALDADAEAVEIEA